MKTEKRTNVKEIMGDVICQNIQTKAIEILNKLNINISEQLLRAASMDVDSIWTGLTERGGG